MMNAKKLLNIVLMAGALLTKAHVEGFNPSITLTGQGGSYKQDWLGQTIIFMPLTRGKIITALDLRMLLNLERDLEFNAGGSVAYRINQDSAVRGYGHLDIRHVDHIVWSEKDLSWFSGVTFGCEYLREKWTMNGSIFISACSAHPNMKGASGRIFRHETASQNAERQSSKALVAPDYLRFEITGYNMLIDGLTGSVIVLKNINISKQAFYVAVAGTEFGVRVAYKIRDSIDAYISMYVSPFGHGDNVENHGFFDEFRFEIGFSASADILHEVQHADKVTALLNKAPRRDMDIIVKAHKYRPGEQHSHSSDL